MAVVLSVLNVQLELARGSRVLFGVRSHLLALDSLKEAHIIDYLLNSRPGLSRLVPWLHVKYNYFEIISKLSQYGGYV